MPLNLMQLQSQLESVPDNSLRGVLGTQAAGLPQFLVMAEFSRRQRMRQGAPLGNTSPTTMLAEMQQGFYQPVPPPPVPPPEQGGIAGLFPQQSAMMGQTLPQAPGMTQASQVQSSLGI